MTDHDHPDTDLTDPDGEAEALRRENERLRQQYGWVMHGYADMVDKHRHARAEAAEAALATLRAQPDLQAIPFPKLRQRLHDAEAALAAMTADRDKWSAESAENLRKLAAAPVTEAQPVAWRVYGMMRQGFPSYVKAKGRAPDQTEYLYPADRGIDAAECARLMRGEIQPLYAHPPVQPTIGGAELDALVKEIEFEAVNGEIDRKLAGRIITALRAQPDWKAMAEASPVAQCCVCGKTGLSTVEDGGPECQLSDGRWVCTAECYDRAVPAPAYAITALSDMAKMKGE